MPCYVSGKRWGVSFYLCLYFSVGASSHLHYLMLITRLTRVEMNKPITPLSCGKRIHVKNIMRTRQGLWCFCYVKTRAVFIIVFGFST